MNHFPANVSTVSPSPATPGQLIGQVRRFGSFGVLYEVLEPINETHFLVRVLDTGEELAYPLTKIVIDPRD